MALRLYGETLDDGTEPRVYASPSATPPLADGDPVDAGTAMILDSSIAWASRESCRHLAADLGPGTVGAYKQRGFDGYRDLTEPDFSGIADLGGSHAGEIAWDRRTARQYGPFFAVVDEDYDDPPRAAPRTIRVVARVNPGGANSLRMYAAVMTTAARPTRDAPVAFEVETLAASGGQYWTKDLTFAAPAALVSVPCRPNGTGGGTTAANVFPFWVWVGWYASHDNDAVLSISVYERRT